MKLLSVFAIILFIAITALSCQASGGEQTTKDTPTPTLMSPSQSEGEPKGVPPTPTIDSSITANFLMGKFNPAQDTNFTIIEVPYAGRQGMYLQKEVYEAFKEMATAAKEDGINFKILSAARNFNYQKGIWERKWTGQTLLEGGENAQSAYPTPSDRALQILKYSSMPGTSRHHWGTDIDLNAFNNSYFEKGRGLEEFQWLEAHAAEFGFCRPYTAKGEHRPTGYEEEKWHWSYLPLSQPYTEAAKELLKNEMITGFMGAETAKTIRVVERYILGIDGSCLSVRGTPFDSPSRARGTSVGKEGM